MLCRRPELYVQLEATAADLQVSKQKIVLLQLHCLKQRARERIVQTVVTAQSLSPADSS